MKHATPLPANLVDRCHGWRANTCEVNRVDILRPGRARVQGLPEAEQTLAPRKEAVLVSHDNLMTYPFVQAEVAAETLTLHGLWTGTGEGGL